MAVLPFKEEPPDGTVLRITMPDNYAQRVYILNRSGESQCDDWENPCIDGVHSLWFTAGSDMWDNWCDVCELIEKADAVEIADWKVPGA